MTPSENMWHHVQPGQDRGVRATAEHAVWATVPSALIGFRVTSARCTRFARHGWG